MRLISTVVSDNNCPSQYLEFNDGFLLNLRTFPRHIFLCELSNWEPLLKNEQICLVGDWLWLPGSIGEQVWLPFTKNIWPRNVSSLIENWYLSLFSFAPDSLRHFAVTLSLWLCIFFFSVNYNIITEVHYSWNVPLEVWNHFLVDFSTGFTQCIGPMTMISNCSSHFISAST